MPRCHAEGHENIRMLHDYFARLNLKGSTSLHACSSMVAFAAHTQAFVRFIVGHHCRMESAQALNGRWTHHHSSCTGRGTNKKVKELDHILKVPSLFQSLIMCFDTDTSSKWQSTMLTPALTTSVNSSTEAGS
jgi:hypothetical protein